MKKNLTALLATLALSLSIPAAMRAESPVAPEQPGASTVAQSQPVAKPLPAATATQPTDSGAPTVNATTEATSVFTKPPTAQDTVNLKPVVVESSSSILNDDSVLTAKGAAAAALERQRTGETDRALNTFTLPLVGQTPEERALAIEREKKRQDSIQDTKRVIETVKKSQPEEAKALKNELNEMAVRNDLIEDTTPSALRRE